MKVAYVFGAGVLSLLLAAPAGAKGPGARLSDLTWIEAEAVLTHERVVVLPLGAAVAQIVRSIARYGPRRFYVLNPGVSTARSVAATVELLAAEGIVLAFSDPKSEGPRRSGCGSRSSGRTATRSRRR
jgi:hypothetical protein